jgi:hypothetical protein
MYLVSKYEFPFMPNFATFDQQDSMFNAGFGELLCLLPLQIQFVANKNAT